MAMAYLRLCLESFGEFQGDPHWYIAAERFSLPHYTEMNAQPPAEASINEHHCIRH